MRAANAILDISNNETSPIIDGLKTSFSFEPQKHFISI